MESSYLRNPPKWVKVQEVDGNIELTTSSYDPRTILGGIVGACVGLGLSLFNHFVGFCGGSRKHIDGRRVSTGGSCVDAQDRIGVYLIGAFFIIVGICVILWGIKVLLTKTVIIFNKDGSFTIEKRSPFGSAKPMYFSSNPQYTYISSYGQKPGEEVKAQLSSEISAHKLVGNIDGIFSTDGYYSFSAYSKERWSWLKKVFKDMCPDIAQ